MITLSKKVPFLIQEEAIQIHNGVLKNVNYKELSAHEQSCCLSLSVRMSIFTTYAVSTSVSLSRSSAVISINSRAELNPFGPHNIRYRHPLSLILENPSLPSQCLFLVIFYDRSVVLCVHYRPPPAGGGKGWAPRLINPNRQLISRSG